MKPALAVFAFSLCLAGLGIDTSFAETDAETYWNEVNKLDWQHPGAEGRLGQHATIKVPEGFAFLGDAGAKKFLELEGNPPRDNRYILAPTKLNWFSVFVFEPIGYVKDDEKIDPDELLATLKESDKAADEERRRLGLAALHLDGWFVVPHYDEETKRLEWATKLRTENNELVVNYTIKLLGRSGVMNAILVSNPSTLEGDIKEFKSALTEYSFNAGERYAEFRAGDKVAQYGLAALVVGGAAAAAAKSGAFKGLAKLIGVGVFGIVAAGVGFFKRLFRRT